MRLSTNYLRAVAAGMRAFCLAANKHPGGSLSCVEALTALYFSGAASLYSGCGDSDHVVYSKGHAAAPHYFALWAHGFFPGLSLEELTGFGQGSEPERLGHSSGQVILGHGGADLDGGQAEARHFGAEAIREHPITLEQVAQSPLRITGLLGDFPR